jgi:V/A-type H+-transporting ATPase subunit I
MAVKEMLMMNLVAGLDDVDLLLRRITLSEQVHIVNAMEEIDESNFTLSMMEENVDEIVNMCAIKPYHVDKNLRSTKERVHSLMSLMGLKERIRRSDFEENYEFESVLKSIDQLHEHIRSIHNKRDAFHKELDKLQQMQVMTLLMAVDVDIGLLYRSKNFHMSVGTLTHENKKKLAQNYENVSAAVMHIGTFNDEEAILVVTPTALKKETERILRSVQYTPIDLMEEYVEAAATAVGKINKRIKQIKYELGKLEKEAASYRETYGDELAKCYSRVVMEETISTLKNSIATTRQFFYLSGWVAKESCQLLKENLEEDCNVIVQFKKVEEVTGEMKPPTQLKNNSLLAPFETLVEMYGTPSYDELDPTAFLGLSYMLLFGAMFGDLGQGLTLALAGILLIKKGVKKAYGQLLIRLGMSSSLFGFFYDSFFGYEHVISSLVINGLGLDETSNLFFIRPIENINTILSVSIALGIVLLLISLGYSIFNKVKAKDYQEGLFGRNGISGLVLYISLLLIVASKAGMIVIGTFPLIVLSILCVGLIVVREPLANYLAGNQRLYHEDASAYYVESGFDILETFLSMLSNSVSFIRVGAFALNHVGLFIAFNTMAEIIGSVAGNITMFIVGNLLVIFLEGLIVFIQGLRLVYYEMFSKYYTGAGQAFKAIRIEAIEEV